MLLPQNKVLFVFRGLSTKIDPRHAVIGDLVVAANCVFDHCPRSTSGRDTDRSRQPRPGRASGDPDPGTPYATVGANSAGCLRHANGVRLPVAARIRRRAAALGEHAPSERDPALVTCLPRPAPSWCAVPSFPSHARAARRRPPHDRAPCPSPRTRRRRRSRSATPACRHGLDTPPRRC